MKEIAQRSELNIHAWANKLRDIDPERSEVLGEDRDKGFKYLEKFDLPRYRTITLPATNFLKNPEATFDTLGTKLFSIQLLPQRGALERKSAAEINRSEVLSFIKENISGNEDGYLIKIIQYFENVYGGGIIIDEDGNIKIDLKPGQSTELAYGTVVPRWTAQSRAFTNTLEYSFEDPQLRSEVYGALSCVPHDENRYMPGNYEFLLVKKPNEEHLSPIFWDCRPDPGFYEANKNKLIEKQKSEEQLEIERRLRHD